jgi:hypothetical protein
MRRFRYLALIGIAVLSALVSTVPAHAAMNHNETFLSDTDQVSWRRKPG